MSKPTVIAAGLVAAAMTLVGPGAAFAQDADAPPAEPLANGAAVVEEVTPPDTEEGVEGGVVTPPEAPPPPEPIEETEPAVPDPAIGSSPTSEEGVDPAPEDAIHDLDASQPAGTQNTGGEWKHASAGARSGKSAVSCLAREVVDGGNPAVHGSLPDGCLTSFEAGEITQDGEVVVDGITFQFEIEDSPDGEVLTFTTDGPFTGTILVKGGKFHFACQFVDVTEGECHAPSKDNSDGFRDISHIDVCVGETPDLPPPPDEEEPPDGGTLPEPPGTGGNPPDGPTVTGPTATAATSLPFTGLDMHWLLLLSGSLIAFGAALRRANG